MKICTTKGCNNKATHLLSKSREPSDTGFDGYAYIGYRNVCKTCGLDGSKNGYHLMKK